MNENELNQSNLHYVLVYVFWLISVVLAVLCLLTWRSSMMLTLGLTPWDRYIEHAINQFGFLIMAIVGLSVIVGAEHYYRTGVPENRLFRRFFLFSFWELVVLTLAHVVRLVCERILALPLVTSLPIVSVELAGCVLLFWLYRRAAQAPSSKIL